MINSWEKKSQEDLMFGQLVKTVARSFVLSLAWQHASKKKLNENDINKGSQFPMRDCKPCPFLLINVYHIFFIIRKQQKVAECAHTYTHDYRHQQCLARQKTKEWESLEIFIIIISCGFLCWRYFPSSYWLFLLLSHVFFVFLSNS